MNLPINISLWEYEAALWNHNEAYEKDDELDAPDPKIAIPMLASINADPRLTGAVH